MANEVHPVSWTGSTHQQPLQSAYLQPLLQFSSSFDRPKRNLTQCGLSMPNAFRSNGMSPACTTFKILCGCSAARRTARRTPASSPAEGSLSRRSLSPDLAR